MFSVACVSSAADGVCRSKERGSGRALQRIFICAYAGFPELPIDGVADSLCQRCKIHGGGWVIDPFGDRNKLVKRYQWQGGRGGCILTFLAREPASTSAVERGENLGGHPKPTGVEDDRTS